LAVQVLQFIKAALSLQSRHWPAKTEKSFIVNAPVWFSYIFGLIRPLLNERQKNKVGPQRPFRAGSRVSVLLMFVGDGGRQVNILDEYSTFQGLREHIEDNFIPQGASVTNRGFEPALAPSPDHGSCDVLSEYGGSSTAEIGQFEVEVKLWDYVEKLVAEQGQSFLELGPEDDSDEEEEASWWF
jgi:hypothetical protein